MRNGLSKDLIARVLGGAPEYTIAELEEKFPLRYFQKPDLVFNPIVPEDGAVEIIKQQGQSMVTRVAPSPTGFMHLGTLYQMLIAKKLAAQSGGVFMLRIEDTDTRREVPGAVDVILKCAREFSLQPDEGPEQGGAYGPYFQSERKEFYHSVVAELLADGRAYLCFLTSEEMEKIRIQQKAENLPTGIYGEFARDRDLEESEIRAKLDSGEVPSIRLYSTGDRLRKIFYNDKVRGRLAFPENDEDIVLIKSSDGLPTYHFAHLCDDHFMRTTLVQRGEEWLPSLNLHLQLFRMMGWTPPEYIHVATINKLDETTGNSRKLSKRTDPEADASMYLQDGWPIEAVLDYLYNIAAAGYEEEKTKKPETDIWNYPLKIKKIPQSPALFNTQKLEWWAREFIAALPVDELTRRVVDWANEYGDEFAKSKAQGADLDYLKKILAIERDNPKRIRKDFITWKQTLEEINYFFDDEFAKEQMDKGTDGQNAPAHLSFCPSVFDKFLETYNYSDDKDTWWDKIKRIAAELNLPAGEAAMALRVAITGRRQTPDLYSIMRVMGEDRVRERVKKSRKDEK